jgi:hypothetical protein
MTFRPTVSQNYKICSRTTYHIFNVVMILMKVQAVITIQKYEFLVMLWSVVSEQWP